MNTLDNLVDRSSNPGYWFLRNILRPHVLVPAILAIAIGTYFASDFVDLGLRGAQD